MKIALTNVSGKYHKVVTVNTIEDLIALYHKYNHAIILQKNYLYGRKVLKGSKDFFYPLTNEELKEYFECEYELEVYDDYRENTIWRK